MQQDKKYYDDFFEKNGANAHSEPGRFMKVAELLHDNVLDIACGTGHLADYFRGDYTGVDISDKAIEIAKELRRKDAFFSQMDFTKRQICLGRKFSSFYIGEFLEHIEDDKMVFENILSCANDGARIVITVPNGDRVPDESHCRTFSVPQIRRDYSKYGFVQFHRWAGFKNRILFTIDIGVKAENDLTLVMIAKNEEKGIEKAIISALDIVGRVIVSVDSSSTDKTREIAKLYADELRTHRWKDDFSAARNEAHQNVKTKWILFLDGHEYIDKFGNVRDYLKLDVDGIFVKIRMESGLDFMYPRIYRRGLQFKNKVHNLVETPKKRACVKFVIVHDRIGGQSKEAAIERAKQRDKMLVKHMKAQLAKNPKDARALFHLGNYYLMRQNIDEAKIYYKRYLRCAVSKEERYMVELQYGNCCAVKGQNIRAMLAFARADKLLPERWETYRVLGGLYLITGRFQKAVEAFVRALEPNKRVYVYQPMKKDLAEIWDLIAHCFVKMDKKAEAITAWQTAINRTNDPKKKKFYNEKLGFAKLL